MKVIRIVTPPLATNVYLLLDEKPSLIDVGGDSKFILDAIRRHIDPKEIKYIFITHSHFDHALAAVDFKRWFGCKIVMHEKEVEMIKRGYTLRPFHLEPDIVVVGGETFDLGEITLEVIHTPGHTLGSVCYYERRKRWLFSGDTVFAYGFGRTDLPGGNKFELIESLKKLAEIDVVNLYPGHDEIVEGEGKKHIEKALQLAKMVL